LGKGTSDSTSSPRKRICYLDKLLAGATGEKRADILEKNRQAAFYEGQIRSAEFFIETLLPVTHGRMNSLQAGNAAAVEIPETAFGAF
jgi:hypothetical protein